MNVDDKYKQYRMIFYSSVVICIVLVSFNLVLYVMDIDSYIMNVNITDIFVLIQVVCFGVMIWYGIQYNPMYQSNLFLSNVISNIGKDDINDYVKEWNIHGNVNYLTSSTKSNIDKHINSLKSAGIELKGIT